MCPAHAPLLLASPFQHSTHLFFLRDLGFRLLILILPSRPLSCSCSCSCSCSYDRCSCSNVAVIVLLLLLSSSLSVCRSCCCCHRSCDCRVSSAFCFLSFCCYPAAAHVTNSHTRLPSVWSRDKGTSEHEYTT